MTIDARRSTRHRAAALFLVAVSTSALASAAAADSSQTWQVGDKQLAAQIEQLKQQIEALEARPEVRQTPIEEGYSPLWVGRGSDLGGSFAHLTRRGEDAPGERGFTIAITPTADLPAPVHEITVSGYVKGDVIYDFDQDLGDFFAYTTATPNGDDDHIRLHARQSRFRIRSKSDTAIGQIRTLIEADFFGSPNTLRMRHAWGEWDMAPGWTLGVGQTWSNFMLLFDLADTIDFNGPAGVSFARQGQVRLTYETGPMMFAVAVENPRSTMVAVPGLASVPDSTERVPDVTGRFEYSIPGGHKVAVSGIVGEQRIDPDASTGATGSNDNEAFWGVIGGVQFNITDMILLSGSGGYGQGDGRYIIGVDVANNVFGFGAANNISTRGFYHFSPNVAVSLTDAITLNAAYGYINFDNSDTVTGETSLLQTFHANILWQPVPQLKMGVEGMWARRDIQGVGDVDLVRAQFGTWFFF